MSKVDQSSKQAIEDKGRRHFVAGAGALAGLMIAPGVTLMASDKPDDQPVSGKVRWGILVDTTKCTSGCNDCVTACNKQNALNSTGHPETDAQWIRTVDIKNLKNGRTTSLPMMCQHCAKPPCVDVCPTGASFKRADGIVLVDRHICIGCRYCMMACPYKARSFVHEEHHDQNPDVPRGKGCVEGCNMCVTRVDAGQLPACVEECRNGAMLFGDLNDPNSEISKRIATYATTQVRADLGLDTGVRYQGI